MALHTVSIKSVIRGYHVYKEHWSPRVGDEFQTELEEFNEHDRYAVAIEKVVGHVPYLANVSPPSLASRT